MKSSELTFVELPSAIALRSLGMLGYSNDCVDNNHNHNNMKIRVSLLNYK